MVGGSAASVKATGPPEQRYSSPQRAISAVLTLQFVATSNSTSTAAGPAIFVIAEITETFFASDILDSRRPLRTRLTFSPPISPRTQAISFFASVSAFGNRLIISKIKSVLSETAVAGCKILPRGPGG